MRCWPFRLPHAQATCDVLVRGGVRAIWNFAPVDLVLPEGVAVNNVHLSDSLHILSYRMNEKELFAAIDAGKPAARLINLKGERVYGF